MDIFRSWLLEQGGAQFIGGVVMGLTLLAVGGYVRHQLMRRSKLWVHACPECGNYDLRRIHRRWYDRVLNLAGIPVRRYRCPNCQWRGPRLQAS